MAGEKGSKIQGDKAVLSVAQAWERYGTCMQGAIRKALSPTSKESFLEVSNTFESCASFAKQAGVKDYSLRRRAALSMAVLARSEVSEQTLRRAYLELDIAPWKEGERFEQQEPYAICMIESWARTLGKLTPHQGIFTAALKHGRTPLQVCKEQAEDTELMSVHGALLMASMSLQHHRVKTPQEMREREERFLGRLQGLLLQAIPQRDVVAITSARRFHPADGSPYMVKRKYYEPIAEKHFAPEDTAWLKNRDHHEWKLYRSNIERRLGPQSARGEVTLVPDPVMVDAMVEELVEVMGGESQRTHLSGEEFQFFQHRAESKLNAARAGLLDREINVERTLSDFFTALRYWALIGDQQGLENCAREIKELYQQVADQGIQGVQPPLVAVRTF